MESPPGYHTPRSKIPRILLVCLVSLILLTVIPAGAGYDQPTGPFQVTIVGPAPGARIPEGTETVFQASIQGGGIQPFSYQWSFGDGTTSSEPEPVHVFHPAAGDINENEGVSHVYTVSLTVRDATGQVGTGETTVEIVAAEPGQGGWFSPVIILGIAGAAAVLIFFRRRGR